MALHFRTSIIAVLLCPLDAGRSYYLAPLFSIVGNELADLDRRHRHRHTANDGKAIHHLWINERRADFLVEFVNDVGGRALGCTDAIPVVRLKGVRPEGNV